MKPRALLRPKRSAAAAVAQPAAVIDPSLLDRLPIGMLVYRHDALLYANRHFLETTGYDDLTALEAAGGLNSLFVERGADTLAESTGTQALSIMTGRGDTVAVDGRLFSVPWNGASALALILTNGLNAVGRRATELALAAAETELRNAKRETQKSAAAKAEFLAKISHEIRTPLNAMTGFAEVMMAERFGPIGNERYREYLKDIHGAGTQLVALLNDLLDLSKVETGKLDLSFGNVGVNDLTQQCVGIMQPQANRARIIIRTSLTPALPQVVADERSLRQIVLNLSGQLDQVHRARRPGDRVHRGLRQQRSGAPRARYRRRHERKRHRGGARAVPPGGDVGQLGLRRNRARLAADQGAGRGQSRQLPHQERAERRHPGRNRFSAKPRRHELAGKRPKAIHRAVIRWYPRRGIG